MQRIKIFIIFVVICLLASAAPVAAQDITPPPGAEGAEAPAFDPLRGFDAHSFPLPEPTVEEGEVVYDTYEKDASIEGMTLMEEQPRAELNVTVDEPLVADADPLTPEIAGPSRSMPADEKEGERTSDGTVAPLTVGGRGGIFPIADATYYEYSPAVAYGNGRYMVVFIVNGDVYVRVYNDYGTYLSTFLVANFTYSCGIPDITFDSYSGLFLVAFEYDYFGDYSDYDVVYTAVSASSGRVGNLWATYTSSGYDEWYPAVACNASYGSCMLAYDYNNGSSIWGFHMLISSSTGIFAWSPSVYQLSTSTNASHPYLAWGGGTGTYMLTFTYYDSLGEAFPFYAHIYDMDDFDPTTPEYVHTSVYAIPATYFPDGHNKYAYGVAFDPCTRKYLIVFEYDFAGDGSDWDVWMVVKHETGPYAYGEMSVASSYEQEWSPDISFVTPEYRPGACGSMDKLVVVYESYPDGIRAADIFGNDSTISPIYYRESYTSHLWVVTCGTGVYCMLPSIAGGWLRGDLFVAFDVWIPGESDEDVYGRMIEVADRTYLPLTAK